MFLIKEGVQGDQIGEGTAEEVKNSMLNWLEGQGLTVRSSEQDESFVQKEVDRMYWRTMSEVDKSILEATGIEKKSEKQKSTEYLQDALELIKSANEKSKKDLNEKIKAFESNGFDGKEEVEKYKTELSNLRRQFKEVTEEHNKKISEMKQQQFQNSVSLKVEKQIEDIKGSLVDNDFMNEIIENRLTKFNKENTPVQFEDQIIWQNPNGETYNRKVDGAAESTKERLEYYFQDLIDKTRKQGGSGSGNGKQNPSAPKSGNPSKESIDLPDNVKTKVDLHNYLSNSEDGPKMKADTKEFSELYNSMGEGLPLR